MKIKLMVLKDNRNSEITNQSDTYSMISTKLKEEYLELEEAITEGDRVHIAEETFDVIQTCIRILVLLAKENFDLEQLSKRHNKKLVNRGWTHSKIIRIFWDK